MKTKEWVRIAAIWVSLGVVIALALRDELADIATSAGTLARERGVSVFRLVETTRLWNAQHGGVYALVTEKTRPNPHLNVPNRDITTQDGRQLTMINPAYMTRQIADLLATENGVTIHLTSLKPIRPDNKADDWETSALQSFENGQTERLELIPGPPPVYRYMAPLRVKQGCMKCHEAQGYKVGQIRGGLSVTIPAAKSLAFDQAHARMMVIKHLVTWFALSLIVTLFLLRQRRLVGQLERLTLEQQDTITQRTAELNKVNRQLQIDRQRYKEYAEMTSDWLWEQGPDLRFIKVSGQTDDAVFFPIDAAKILGKTLEETGIQTQTEEMLSAWKALIEQHLPFRDFECYVTNSRGQTRWFRLSGRPIFDEDKGFLGYHGTGRDITEARRSREILDRINRATASISGDAFYVALCENLTELFGARCVYLATLSDAGDTLTTRSVWIDGKASPNFDFHLHGTPCARVIRECVTIEEQDVRARFAGSSVFRMIDARTYLGTPVINHKGEVMGTLAVIDAGYPPRAQEQAFLKIFSARAALEIERQETIAKMHRVTEDLRLAATVINRTREGVIITNARAIIQDVNPAFCELTGYSLEELRGRNPNLLKSGRHDKSFYETLWSSIIRDGTWTGEIWNRRKDGSLLPQIVNIDSLSNDHGEVTHYVGVFTDISLIKDQQQKLEDMAFYDRLTGLPNRSLLSDRMDLAIADAQRHQQQLAIAFLDLDGFKAVNDALGHNIGDQLLIQVAHRLRDCMRASDTVARLGGDEFVLIIRDLQDTLELERSLERVLRQMRAPYILGDHTCSGISGSLGVAIYPTHGTDAGALLRASDSAMYQAKQAGGNCYRFFRSLT